MHVPLCSGFIVVRLPLSNFDADGRGVYPRTTPRRSAHIYGGIDRMPWFDIDELSYSRDIARAKAISKQLAAMNRDFTGVSVGPLALATEAMRLLGEHAARNEIIGVYSDRLRQLKGVGELPPGWEFAGLDIVSSEGLSAVRDGLFESNLFEDDWLGLLNPNGLITDVPSCWRYVEAYSERVAATRRDDADTNALDFVEVYKERV